MAVTAYHIVDGRTNMADEASILCWSGGWGLPSLDPACLQALTYSKFAGFPLKVTECNNPYKSPTVTLPVLRVPNDIFYGCDDVLNHLKTNNYNTDEELTDKQKIDTLALCCYVEDMLRPAVMYMMWLDDQNYNQFTRGWYAKQLKFPYNYFVPAKYFNHSKNFVAHKLNIEESDVISEETEESLHKRAQACFKTLSNLLGDQEFFFGTSPTTLDSKVLAYLALILKAPLPKNKLKSQLLAYPNMEQFCERILHLFFPSTGKDQMPASNSVSSVDNQDENRHSKIKAFLSIGFGFVAMIFYALSSGLVTIEVVAHEKHDTCRTKTSTGKESGEL